MKTVLSREAIALLADGLAALSSTLENTGVDHVALSVDALLVVLEGAHDVVLEVAPNQADALDTLEGNAWIFKGGKR